jgi:hypothetical protein
MAQKKKKRKGGDRRERNIGEEKKEAKGGWVRSLVGCGGKEERQATPTNKKRIKYNKKRKHSCKPCCFLPTKATSMDRITLLPCSVVFSMPFILA